MISEGQISAFKKHFDGEVYDDHRTRWVYSTDASAYREQPILVTIPKTLEDLRRLIEFAHKVHSTLILRTAGTSLAGQVVGNGIIVDVSKYFNKIIELNEQERWVKVQPGVNLDELNAYLGDYDLFFGPETSTSNRCMIGGMVGNNSCGSHSLIYGSTRDHLLATKVLLSDGSEHEFRGLSKHEFDHLSQGDNLVNNIYKQLSEITENEHWSENIRNDFPKANIRRRNTGYAIDELLLNSFLMGGNHNLNLCNIIAGSEGTLAITTEITLNLVKKPPALTGLVCAHFDSLEEAMEANLIALNHRPRAIELIDDIIISCTKNHAEHQANRFFIEGEPKAILLIEYKADDQQAINVWFEGLIADLKSSKKGYAFPLITGDRVQKVWQLRKDSLGLLSNLPGDAKPVSLVEDTAVLPEDLPAYISDFKEIMNEHNLNCVYHAHIATGELHLRPVIDLKTKEGVQKFRKVGAQVANLVKKYKGSLSGEHGDGRLRGEFISKSLSPEVLELMTKIKKLWDPQGIFNQGKIVETKPMDVDLRYDPSNLVEEPETLFDFSATQGMLRMAEQCTGSAVCRKSHLIGGTMCPTFMATRDEDKTTRARANVLREYLTKSEKNKRFNNREINEALDLCISCKGCKKECPSNVDMALLKAEFQHQYHKHNGAAWRDKVFGHFSNFMKVGYPLRGVLNFVLDNPYLNMPLKVILGIHKRRSLPLYSTFSLNSWIGLKLKKMNDEIPNVREEVYLFVDEFTNYNDADIGVKTIKLLTSLGIKVNVIKNLESARSQISKGFLDEAKEIAVQNVELFAGLIKENKPLVGIEPSAVLTFKDEYPLLLRGQQQKEALNIKNHTFLIEDYLSMLFNKYDLRDKFTDTEEKIVYHGHCHQKALVGTKSVSHILAYPMNYQVEILDTGCCGMAGSFGYQKKYFDLSQKIGQLKLFPAIENMAYSIFSASGTSCRHQIRDFKQINPLHPVEILCQALKK